MKTELTVTQADVTDGGSTPRNWPRLSELALVHFHTALGGQALLVRASLHKKAG